MTVRHGAYGWARHFQWMSRHRAETERQRQLYDQLSSLMWSLQDPSDTVVEFVDSTAGAQVRVFVGGEQQ